MAVPQNKTSRARRDRRRSHHRAVVPTMMECPNCHSFKLTHTICTHCGFYKGRQIIKPREA